MMYPQSLNSIILKYYILLAPEKGVLLTAERTRGKIGRQGIRPERVWVEETSWVCSMGPLHRGQNPKMAIELAPHCLTKKYRTVGNNVGCRDG